jgi:hypothetical protein
MGRATVTKAIVTLCALMLLALPMKAHSQSQAEKLGPQFAFGWSAAEQETVIKALRSIEGEGWVDDMLMERQKRIISTIERGYAIYDQDWKPVQPFVLHGPDGGEWSIIAMSLPMVILSGIAVSRDRYCRAEDQDIGEDQIDLARSYCADANSRAVSLFDRSFSNLQHMTPGGVVW